MRKLTVSSLYRDTVQKPSDRSRPERVPHLRLSGKWLASAGFPAGARVTVSAQGGQLIISAE